MSSDKTYDGDNGGNTDGSAGGDDDADGGQEFSGIPLMSRNDMKRRTHNGVEKRRKDKINHWIYKLADQLPFKETKRVPKIHLLENVYQYINQLRDKNDSLVFGNINNINAIHVEEIRRLTKRCKDLEEKNISYYHLLETAGISPNAWPQDLHIQRPTKYSKKLNDQKLNDYLEKNGSKLGHQFNNNKRVNDFDDNSSLKKSKKSKKRKSDKRDNDRQRSTPTPVLPNTIKPLIQTNTLTINSAGQLVSSANNSGQQIIILNDPKMSTVGAATGDEMPRLLLATNGVNDLNQLNTLQLCQSMGGSQQLQFLSTGGHHIGNSLDTIHSNNNLLSGQILLNLNPPAPPPPQATAVLLPNGQLLPIITQPQVTQQQQLIYTPNKGLMLCPTANNQPTLFTGQTVANSIASNINTNTIKLIQSPVKTPTKTFVDKSVNKDMTTTIETIQVSDGESSKHVKTKKVIKKHKNKQMATTNVKKDATLSVSEVSMDDKNDKLCNITANLKIISVKTTSDMKGDDKSVINNGKQNKSKNKSRLSDKSDEKLAQVLANTSAKSDTKSASKALAKVASSGQPSVNRTVSCDILAKATQSIFSSPMANTKGTAKQVSATSKQNTKNKNSNKIDLSISDVINNNNNNNKSNTNKTISTRKRVSSDDKNSNICGNNNNKSKKKETQGTGSGSEKPMAFKTSKKSSNKNSKKEVISEYSVNTLNEDNNCDKTMDLFNDISSKTTNYVDVNQTNGKNQQKLISNGNEDKCKKSHNNSMGLEKVNVIQDSGNASGHKILSTNVLTSSPQQESNVCTTEHTFNVESITANSSAGTVDQPSDTGASDGTGIHFEFSLQDNQTNANNTDNSSTHSDQTLVNESELPSLLLSSLNDENEVSVQSVSNSSLPGFLSLSPEHLNEYLPKDSITNGGQESDHNSEAIDKEPSQQQQQSAANEMQSSVNTNNNTTVKGPQNASQTQNRPQSAASGVPQQQQQPSKPSSVPQPSNQNQSNATVMALRSHRNSSTEQQLQTTAQRRPSQPQQQTQHTSPSNSTSAANSMNKNTASVATAVHYPTHHSFSSYSAESLIRPNEPSVHQIASNNEQQNRYIPTSNATNTSAVQTRQQSQNSHHSFNNTESNAIRSSSRATISYSAESLIQSNPTAINAANPMSNTNKSSQRDVDNESVVNTDNSNRISYYQHINPNNTSNNSTANNNTNTNQMQRTDQNNANNNLFNFDHSLNTRLMANTASTPISQSCNNSYPQIIPFNSYLPDIRTSLATTTTSESLFPITSNATTVNSNSNRNLSSNSGLNSVTNSSNNLNNNNKLNANNLLSHSVHNSGVNQQQQPQLQPQSQQQPQHSPIIYSNQSTSNVQQNKRTTNTNTFNNTSANAFIHSNLDSYGNNNNANNNTSVYSMVDTSGHTNANHYQRSTRNDNRFVNCLQTTGNQNNTASAVVTPPQNNTANTGCLFSNTGPNTTYFPTTTGTPFPPLLPSAASPFDPTAAFTGAHRPPIFTNTFMPDFNAPFVNPGPNNPFPPITGPNFHINPTIHPNTGNTVSTKSRDSTNSRSSSSNMTTRSPNTSKATKAANNGSTNSKSKKQNSSKNNTNSSDANTSNHSLRQLNDNYFSMNELMSLSTPSVTQNNSNRYTNFLPNNSQTQNTSTSSRQQPVPSPASVSSNSNPKNSASSADTSSSYTLFRPQSQNSNNTANPVSNAANFSVNLLHNSNRSAAPATTTTTTSSSSSSQFGTTYHHSSNSTNFHLSNLFPDINAANSLDTISLSPMKFPPPPPVTAVVPPHVAPPLGHASMDMSANPYPNHHPSGHHQNLYPTHHSSASRISAPHNAFNSFLSSGPSVATHNPNAHSFDPQITPTNSRTPSSVSSQMPAIGGANSTAHMTAPFTPTPHPNTHHTYTNIVPSFNF